MNKKSESGQAIALLVFAIIGLLGFTALAIDGGMVYSDRRQAQSASDAASLAGGGEAALDMENNHIFYNDFDCSDSDITTIRNNAVISANNRAISNDYDNAEITVTTVCEDNGSIYDKKYIDITTQIVKETNTTFIHFAYDGPATNQVESTVRVRPRTPLAYGHAIVALNEDCGGNDGFIIGGASKTYIHGGGLFSNGCLTCRGNGPNFEAIIDPPDGNFYVDSTNCGSQLDPAPEPTDTSEPLPPSSYHVEPPDCSGLPNRTQPSGGEVTLEPGVYNQIVDGTGSHSSVTLNPGLYCVTGSPKAVRITSGALHGDGVTIYVLNGDVQISGGGNMDEQVYLSAPVAVPDPYPAIPGMVIYLAPGNENEVKLTGNSESIFNGTVYVPDGRIFATGSSELGQSFNTQLIAYNIKIIGSTDIDINFLSENLYTTPTSIDLTR